MANNNKSNNRGNNNSTNNSALAGSNKNASSANSILTMAVLGGVGLFLIYYIYTVYKSMTKDKKKDTRPYPKCPDYWESEGNSKCKNTHKIGLCRTGKAPNDSVDFSDDIFTNKMTGNYMKCKWAKSCQVPWEGIDDLCS